MQEFQESSPVRVISKAIPQLYFPVRIIELRTDMIFSELTQECTRLFSQRYPAWEDVRKNRAGEVVGNLNGLPPIGTEGYYVGLRWEPEQIVADEVDRGQYILDSIARDCRSDYRRRRAAYAVVHGEGYSLDGLTIIDTLFGAQLGRLRALIFSAHNDIQIRENSAFRRETEQRVRLLPAIQYSDADEAITITYSLPQPVKTFTHGGVAGLTEKQKEAYLAFEGAARVTVPLIRELVRYHQH